MTYVKLVYFRESGKYYSEGEYNSDKTYFHQVLDEVLFMLKNGERPGLVNGFEFNVLITIYTEHGPLSHLFVRDKE